jgi:methylated-DNA-[protein]-cysteine S-methyltransferase
VPKFSSHISSSEDPILGTLWAAATDKGLIRFEFGLREDEFLSGLTPEVLSNNTITKTKVKAHLTPTAAINQVEEYLAGKRQRLSLPIDWQQFTDFQIDVYRAVISVPFGQTCTYGQIAAQIGRPKAARAVGAANAANPLPIIIPCHRLVGKDGTLRGYGGKGGIQTKQWLLDLENRYSRNRPGT